MKKLFIIVLIFFFLQNYAISSVKEKITDKLIQTNSISFNFIQTIDGKDEKGECIIEYPKKISCKYDNRKKKVIVSNGSSLVIKTNTQYYRYALKNTPLEIILDKNYLINKVKSSTLNVMDEKYVFLQILENNKNMNIFFSKENFEIVGWQIEDVYQNLSVTYIFNTLINPIIDQKVFKLPTNN